MGSEGGSRKCVSCGREIAMDANVCQYCGHDYRALATAPAQKEKSVMPIIGGVLILVGGLIELLAGLALVGSIGVLDSAMPIDFEGVDVLNDIVTVCGAILIILGLVGVVGGVFGIMRKHYGLALLGGVLALPGWFVPALIGLILVAISKKDFD